MYARQALHAESFSQNKNNSLKKYITCKNLKQHQTKLPKLQALAFKSKQQQTFSLNTLISLLAWFWHIAKLQKNAVSGITHAIFKLLLEVQEIAIFDEITNKIE